MLNSLNNIWCDAFEIVRPGSLVSVRHHDYATDKIIENEYIVLGPTQMDPDRLWLICGDHLSIMWKDDVRFIK